MSKENFPEAWALVGFVSDADEVTCTLFLACLVQTSAQEWDRQREERKGLIHMRWAYDLFNKGTLSAPYCRFFDLVARCEGDFENAMLHFQQTDCDPRQILVWSARSRPALG